MKNNPGYDGLSRIFAAFAAKYNPAGLMSKVPAISKDAAKEFAKIGLDKDFNVGMDDMKVAGLRAARKALPREGVEEFFNDVHGILKSQAFVENLSVVVQSADMPKALEMSNKFIDRLKEPKSLQMLAQQFKMMSSQASFPEFKASFQFFLKVDKLPPMGEQVFGIVMDRIEPIYDLAKDASTQEIADMIAAELDSVPFDQMFTMVFSAAQFVTPESVSAVVNQYAQAIPTGQQAGDLYDMLYTKVSGELPPQSPPKPPKKPKGGSGGFSF